MSIGGVNDYQIPNVKSFDEDDQISSCSSNRDQVHNASYLNDLNVSMAAMKLRQDCNAHADRNEDEPKVYHFRSKCWKTGGIIEWINKLRKNFDQSKQIH